MATVPLASLTGARFLQKVIRDPLGFNRSLGKTVDAVQYKCSWFLVAVCWIHGTVPVSLVGRMAIGSSNSDWPDFVTQAT